MADKIANIKWLRDQGWDIPSSYASGLCPTCNAIENEIPKDSVTVIINSRYSNNQLVCEKDITIQGGSPCPTYNLTPNKQVTCSGGTVQFTATSV